MAEPAGYGQFCPVAMASEILCSRWTILILREFLCGTTRFNDLRRGVPRMSPALLSKRLKELERAGVVMVVRHERGQDYRLTQAGEDLRPVVMGLGAWGQRWVDAEISLRNLDPSLLMWDMRRNLNPSPLPPRRCTIQFQYLDLSAPRRNWWLVVKDGEVDLCSIDPGFEVDLLVAGALRSMTAIWMGVSTLAREVEAGRLELIGEMPLARSMQQWLGLSPFARQAS
jgi:DNA-binding HxlR family transcriptional regulator